MVCCSLARSLACLTLSNSISLLIVHLVGRVRAIGRGSLAWLDIEPITEFDGTCLYSIYTVIMRLLTHNLLACHSRHCTQTSNNFPLQFKDVKLELLETDFNEAFVRGFLPKLDWHALVSTARQLGDTTLPETSPDLSDPMLDDELLHNLHHVLLEVGKCCSLFLQHTEADKCFLFSCTSQRER